MKIKEVNIDFLGHAGFLINNGDGKKVVIDPYNVSGNIDKADLILITHSHFDHCSIKDITKLAKPGTIIVIPADAQSKITKIEGLERRVREMEQSKIAQLPEAAALLRDINALLGQILPLEPPIQIYVVEKGDYLWKISGKQEIYGDPYQWIRIYTYNRDQIQDPDLIYPDQRFKIHKEVGPDEHLVARGEWLSKISGYSNIYNDPFKWNRIYEANQTVIEDPNLIYPYMVLRIPRN